MIISCFGVSYFYILHFGEIIFSFVGNGKCKGNEIIYTFVKVDESSMGIWETGKMNHDNG